MRFIINGNKGITDHGMAVSTALGNVLAFHELPRAF
jgi:hypothetical protein